MWCEEAQTYAVYWASNLYEDGIAERRNADSYNRMMIATTDDFVTFTEPRVWIDVRRAARLRDDRFDGRPPRRRIPPLHEGRAP